MTSTPRFTVTAIDQSGYISAEEGTIVIAGAAWPDALAEYERLLREQVDAFGPDTYGPQAKRMLREASESDPGTALLCSFADSWLVELRPATGEEYPTAERIQAAGEEAQFAFWA